MPRNVISMQEKRPEEKQRPPRRRHLGIILIGAMLLFALASMSLVNAYQNLQKQVTLEQEAIKKDKDLDDKATLKSTEISKLKDPQFIEKYARARYSYSKNGEKVFTAPGLVNGGINSDQ
ncbi:septum formation initiator family protein [Lactococcus termiticola]|uniref:Septum formation initiator n=1 Tax=Lactococcus termiticola TaxID=2169526 RepID=A0A2R5HFQ0_9LACT|nr:septum formation initiator family protein [Lactococcus termiticola]GBG96877.1 septum formation initiator [Lactococcus termiticola]